MGRRRQRGRRGSARSGPGVTNSGGRGLSPGRDCRATPSPGRPPQAPMGHEIVFESAQAARGRRALLSAPEFGGSWRTSRRGPIMPAAGYQSAAIGHELISPAELRVGLDSGNWPEETCRTPAESGKLTLQLRSSGISWMSEDAVAGICRVNARFRKIAGRLFQRCFGASSDEAR